jgi:hypothetical protein
MGIGTQQTADMKKKIAEIFAEHVEGGESYTTFAAYYMLTTKKLLKEIRTFYNYIIGYKDGDDPEAVVIAVSEDLDSIGGPVRCRKSECSKAGVGANGMFYIKHSGLDGGGIDFTVIVTKAAGAHMIDVNYVEEFQQIMEFFQNRFTK